MISSYFFHPFCQVYSVTMLRQLSAVITGTLYASHNITMRNIACLSTYGYRTVQRFSATEIHWLSLHTAFVMATPPVLILQSTREAWRVADLANP